MRRPKRNQHVNVIRFSVDDQCGPFISRIIPPRYANKSSRNSGLINGRRCEVEKMKCNKIFPDVCGIVLRPPGLAMSACDHPWLAPWAALFRRFAAAAGELASLCTERSLTCIWQTLILRAARETKR